MKSIIECIGRQELTDKNGKTYSRLFFKNWNFFEFVHPMTGEKIFVREHSPIGHVNQYEESYTSSKRPDPYYNLKVGEYVTGEVVQRTVQPYTTEKGFTINYYNAVVFGDSEMSGWENRIRETFERNGMTLLPNTEHIAFEVVAKEQDKETVTVISPEDRKKIALQISQEEHLIKESLNF
jgi:hypothetical protein